MTKSPSFFRVQHRNLWGDYGHILIAGIAVRRGKNRHDRDAPLLLQRTGPFAPSVTLPGTKNIVITDNCRGRIAIDRPEVEFRPVVKQRIVFSCWENWDWEEDEPEEYPEEGEPENYIMNQPHSDEAAAEMGDMWELPVAIGVQVDTDVRREAWDYDLRIHLDTWNGNHIVLASKHGARRGTWLVVSGDGRKFLETYDTEELLGFEPCLVK